MGLSPPHKYNLTSLVTFHCPCIFYINSLQDYSHKTVQIVYVATKQTISTCYNYCFTDCILSFNNDCVNILIYLFY